MRIPQKMGRKGSLKWIQVLVNTHASIFDREISADLKLNFDKILWLSPLAKDDYSEYRDEDFLDVLGLIRFSDKLKAFWPKNGPQWDALGRAKEGGAYFLVEAKANIPEITSSMMASAGASIGLIRKSLGETADYLGCRYSDLWENGFYQYVNRLAHLYFLRQVCGVEAYLVFLYFVGDVGHIPTSLEQWQGALSLQKSLLGLQRHRLGNFVAEVFFNADDLQNW